MKTLSNLIPQWPATFTKLASSFVIVIGAMAIIGWAFSFWLPNVLLPFLAVFKPLTAVCFILAGMALWLRTERDGIGRDYLAEICAGFIFIIAILTLFEYCFNVDLGIDKRLFKDYLESAPTFSPPGRMSPFSATNFALLGAVLFLQDHKLISFRVIQTFIAISIAITFFELLVNIYIGSFTPIEIQYTLVSIPLIMTFLLLELGLLLGRPTQGIAYLITNRSVSGELTRRLILPSIIFPIFLAYLELVGIKAGLYEEEFGVSLLVLSITALYIGLILINGYFNNELDIKRLKAEREMKFSQKQLQDILDHTNTVVYLTDPSGKFLLVNRQFEKLFHKSNIEIIGNTIHHVFPKAIANKFVENNQRVLQSREPLSIEEVVPDKQELRTFISSKFPLFNEQGAAYAIGGISTDITEMKKMDKILLEKQERFNLALKSAQAGTWSWDIVEDKIVWDEYMHYLFGIKPESFLGKYDFAINLIHRQDRQRVADEIQRALLNRTEFETEFRVPYAHNLIRNIALRGKIYRDESNQAVHMTGVCWDITQRKHAEEELVHSKEKAEKLAEKAEEANHAKSAFLAAMSHEIRTPLNGVIGMTSLLLDTPLSAEQREYIEIVLISGEALLSIINDILDFSKIESGHMELEHIHFNIQELADDAVEMVAIETHKKGIAVGAFIESDMPEWFNGDPARIRQVLNNLLSNAAKFTEKGEISLRIKLNKLEGNEALLQFEVIDTGSGISPEARPRLFQAFSQGDISTSRKHGGTGLGLVICKRLVEIMGGTIDVESIPNGGSRFWFTIKLEVSDTPGKKIEYKLLPELAQSRILCVDDNTINRDIVKRQITTWKMRCDVASNAAEALALLAKAVQENDPYKLVLIDYIMPGMNGLELIQLMRKLDDFAHTPVVIMSPLGATFGLDEMKKLNISMCITKPSRQYKLYETIIAVLKNKSDAVIADQPFTSSPTEMKNFRILLAEDNPVNQQVALRILTKKGYLTDTVKNGLEALHAIQNTSYDLILMDCQMPDMDGYRAATEIRKFEEPLQKHTPIIAMTAHALKGDRQKCISSGMDDYIAKPIDVKALAAMLERWLSVGPVEKPVIMTNTNDVVEKLIYIDMDRIHGIFGDDYVGIKEFLKSFVLSTSNILKELKQAIQNQDQQLVKNIFHQLKGSTGNCGALTLYEQCLKAEKYVQEPDWKAIDKLYDEMIEIFKNMQLEITEKFTIELFK